MDVQINHELQAKNHKRRGLFLNSCAAAASQDGTAVAMAFVNLQATAIVCFQSNKVNSNVWHSMCSKQEGALQCQLKLSMQRVPYRRRARCTLCDFKNGGGAAHSVIAPGAGRSAQSVIAADE